jgi:hypothetical protein
MASFFHKQNKSLVLTWPFKISLTNLPSQGRDSKIELLKLTFYRKLWFVGSYGFKIVFANMENLKQD